MVAHGHVETAGKNVWVSTEGRKCDTVVESRLQGCSWVTPNEASRVLELGKYGGPKV